ncbi:hypothetical protein BD324DRAFT_621800 [Kockovaella imperatae]|uniref:Uncharacterized protein n=1 Tax=Kockovaella imperatae TaxID=4999 RepID=A0A1Y1UKS1_9TREE|nr:hypothetical protein BD324DRAFT_621800 [Kockovaella imperatae]ORX38651.1 hypothetical protein BD324DRAFT_621800 [Kockovaella imperatae]
MPAAEAPTQLEQTSAVLGEYMLKGWTLTDLHCDQCCVTPLMREPTASATAESRQPIQFCALCDGPPSASAQSTATRAVQSTSRSVPSAPTGSAPASTLLQSGPNLENPIYNPSSSSDDTASQISSLLLRGYSLLGTNCPSSTCRGIPLVGYPRGQDGKKDNRRLCVECGSRWIDGGEGGGGKLKRLPVGGGDSLKGHTEKGKEKATSLLDLGLESPRTMRRNQLYGLVPTKEKEESNSSDLEDEAEVPSTMLQVQTGSQTSSAPPSLILALEHTSKSLALTLNRFAVSLERHTLGTDKEDESRYFVDVKLHMDAMKDVLGVLGMVQELRR